MGLRTLLLGFLCLLPTGGIAHAKNVLEHDPGKSLTLRVDDATLWSYHFAKEGGVPYFHPVTTPGGSELTWFAPADHVWHRGVWFSWKYLNGVNYWEFQGQDKPYAAGRTQTIGTDEVCQDDSAVTIATRLVYSHGESLVLAEQRTIRIELPRPDGGYAMDWQMVFTAADQEVVFGRASPKKHSWGGYAGLSYRASRNLVDRTVINSTGLRDKAGHGEPARWMSFRGNLPDKKQASISMFDHPQNPRHPTPWYVYTDKMGYFNPALLFNEPYTLSAGESLTLRYRLLVHPEVIDAKALDQEYEAFVGQTFLQESKAESKE